MHHGNDSVNFESKWRPGFQTSLVFLGLSGKVGHRRVHFIISQQGRLPCRLVSKLTLQKERCKWTCAVLGSLRFFGGLSTFYGNCLKSPQLDLIDLTLDISLVLSIPLWFEWFAPLWSQCTTWPYYSSLQFIASAYMYTSRRTQSMKLSIDQNRCQSISIDNN